MVTYSKLRDGTWGLRGPVGELVAGATVTVSRRDGTTRTETVGRVLWHDATTALAATGGSARTMEPCAECGARGRRLTDCQDSSGIVGPCCPQCAQMPACERSFA